MRLRFLKRQKVRLTHPERTIVYEAGQAYTVGPTSLARLEAGSYEELAPATRPAAPRAPRKRPAPKVAGAARPAKIVNP